MSDPTPQFEPVHTESTAVIIARSIRDAVEKGHFQGGQQLVETELAGEFKVSRGVLREALQRLTQEGLLVSRPNRGVFVTEFDAEEVFDIYTARLAIERAACLKVIDVLDRAEALADLLDELTDRLEQQVAAGTDVDEFAQLDIEFHERLVAEAESPRLSRMYETLATESRMCVIAFEGVKFPFSTRIEDHRIIADAIRRRDKSALNEILAAHMDHAIRAMSREVAEASPR